MEKTDFKLDRSASQILSYEEAERAINSSERLSWEERINQFNYLMSIAYRFVGDQWPRMDKSIFEKRKQD